MKLPHFILTFIVLVHSSFLYAKTCAIPPQVNWQSWRANDTTKVSFSSVNGESIQALKGDIILPTTIDNFYHFLQQEQLVPKWLDRVESVKIVPLSTTASVITTAFEGVLFIRPRILTAKSSVVHHDQQTMIITVENIASNVIQQNKIPMTMRFGCWHITQQDNAHIAVTYQFLVIPNGDIPAWLVNNLAKKSLWKSLENLQQLFEKPL